MKITYGEIGVYQFFIGGGIVTCRGVGFSKFEYGF